MFDDIKLGDTVGKANFPYVLGVVIQKTSRAILVELPPKQGSNGRNVHMVVQKKDVDKGIYGKIEIQDAEIVGED